MKLNDITIEVRDSDLKRQGQITQEYWSAVKFIPTFLGVGSWSLTLPHNHPMSEVLRQPGSGILVTVKDDVLMSGPMISASWKATSDDLDGTWTFVGADDNVVLADALAWPVPTNPDVTQQTDDSHDSRSGPAETVIRGYIDANIGPSAPSSRKGKLVSHLVLEPDQARGDIVYGSARFDVLGALVEPLAQTGGLGYRVIQEDETISLNFFIPADKSKLIRLDIANGGLSSTSLSKQAPKVTNVIVAGQGQGTERTFLEMSDNGSNAAADEWGRRIEEFKDQRQTDDPNELAQAGNEELVNNGRTITTMKITPSDDLSMQYGRGENEWFIGDKITVISGTGEELTEVVTSSIVQIDSDGLKVGVEVGAS